MKKEIINNIAIVLLALLVAFEFILLTDELDDQQQEINNLRHKIKELEVNYNLYQYNMNELQEYYNGKL